MQNQHADALATLATMVDEPKGAQLRPIVVEQKEEHFLLNVDRGRQRTE